MSGVQVKICGLTRPGDAVAAARAGARFGGVILAPGGRRTIEASIAAAIFQDTDLVRVGVFVDQTVEDVQAAAHVAGLHVVQLHGSEPLSQVEQLRAAGLQVWKAVRVRDAEEIDGALQGYGAAVDGLLLDGWAPHAAGGTGTRFPWAALAARRDSVPESLRLIVAGGLDPHNVAEAVGSLRPDVVDVSSGVEQAPGIKDIDAIEKFVRAAHAAALAPN